MNSLFIFRLMIITICVSCTRMMSDGTLKPRYVKKWYKENNPFEFKSSNTSVRYLLDKDSLRFYREHQVSFCTQLENEFTKAQDFFQNNFSFDKVEPLDKKAFYCGLDTCLFRNLNSNCQFTLYYLSKETELVNRKRATLLEQLLIRADTFYAAKNTRNYRISIRIQIDLNFSLDIQTREPICDANYSTTFYVRKNSDADRSDWNSILPEHTNEQNYIAFVDAYHKELIKACAMATFKFEIIKKTLNSSK